MNNFSPANRGDVVSQSLKCRGSFTTTCGAGYKRFDNPQIELLFSLPDDCCFLPSRTANSNNLVVKKSAQARFEHCLASAFSAAKVSFELRRFLPMGSRCFCDSLGFCLVRADDDDGAAVDSAVVHALGRRINNKIHTEIAQSSFQSSDVVTLSISGAQLLLAGAPPPIATRSISSTAIPNNSNKSTPIVRVIAVLYTSAPFCECEFQFCATVTQPRKLAEGVRITVREMVEGAASGIAVDKAPVLSSSSSSTACNEAAAASPSPAAPPRTYDYNSDFDDDDVDAGDTGAPKKLQVDDDDDDDWIVPPPPLADDGDEDGPSSSSGPSSGPSHCSEVQMDDDDAPHGVSPSSSPSPPAPPADGEEDGDGEGALSAHATHAEQLVSAAQRKGTELALRCVSLSILPERSIQFSDVVEMKGETGGGYGSPNAPQFNLLITKRQSSAAAAAAASLRTWGSISATIEMSIKPVVPPQLGEETGAAAASSELPAAGVGGIRFFVAEATSHDAAFYASASPSSSPRRAIGSAADVPRLKGYFPTGDEQLFVEKKLQQQLLKRKALREKCRREREKKRQKTQIKNNNSGGVGNEEMTDSSSSSSADDDEPIVQPASSSTSGPWRDALAKAKEGSPSAPLLLGLSRAGATTTATHLISDVSISREGFLLLGAGGGGAGRGNNNNNPDEEEPTKVWRSIFMSSTSISFEGILLIDNIGNQQQQQQQQHQQHLFRILTCTAERNMDCSVHVSVKLFPEPSLSSSSSSLSSSSSSSPPTIQDFLMDYDVQFCGSPYVPLRFQPRDFLECFPSRNNNNASSSNQRAPTSHVVYENIVCRHFYRVDDARAIVDRINAACEQAAALTESQGSGVSRQYSAAASSPVGNCPLKNSSRSSDKSHQRKHIVFHDSEFPPFTHRSINLLDDAREGSSKASSSSSLSASPLIKSSSPVHKVQSSASAIRLEHLDEKWLRPVELSNRPCMFFSPDSTRTGLPVQSSLLGNCGVLSSLAAIAAASPFEKIAGSSSGTLHDQQQQQQATATRAIQSQSRLSTILRQCIYPNFISGGPSSSSASLGGSALRSSAFCVAFFVGGEWRAVIVDDFLPCVRGRLAFSTSTRRDEMWVPLYEKALAKVFGSYSALKGAVTIDAAFQMLSGGVGSSVYFSREVAGAGVSSPTRRTAALLERVMAYHLNGWPMCVSSDRPGEGEKIREHSGIVSNHGYSVLDVVVLAAPPGGGGDSHQQGDVEGSTAFLLLRNPWNFGCEKNVKRSLLLGKGTTTTSPQQQQRQRRLMQQQHHRRDGTFWISLRRLMREFDYMSFCRITSDELQRKYRLLVPVSGSDAGAAANSNSGNSSGWCVDPTENAQVVIRFPSFSANNSISSGGSNDGNQTKKFLRVRISVDAIGVRGGGFHFHVIPLLRESDDDQQQRTVDFTRQLCRLEGVSTRDISSSSLKDEQISLAALKDASVVAGAAKTTAAANTMLTETATAVAAATKFFLSHSAVEHRHVAHAQGYFGAVFESDGVSAESQIFCAGQDYLLLPYAAGGGGNGGGGGNSSGFDGAFAITVEMSVPSTHPQPDLLYASLPPPANVPFSGGGDAAIDKFTLACGHRSTVNPQFLLVNKSRDFPIAVRIACQLTFTSFAAKGNTKIASSSSSGSISDQQRQQLDEEPGLEVLLVHAPPDRTPPRLLGGKAEVEAALVAASHFYRARRVELVAVLEPGRSYVVMPSRRHGTEAKVRISVSARVTHAASLVQFSNIV